MPENCTLFWRQLRRRAIWAGWALIWQAGNEEVAAAVKGHADRLIPFAVLNPAYAGCKDDLETCVNEFGAKGLRLCLPGTPTPLPLADCWFRSRFGGRCRQRSWLADVPDRIAALVQAAPPAHFILVNARLFGTGIPFHDADPAILKLEILDVAAAVKNKARRGNTARLLGMER